MGKVFLVGFVAAEGQAEQAVEAVRGVAGVRSVDSYLPVSPGGSTEEAAARKVRDAAITGEVKGALALDPAELVTRIDVKTLAGHVVLLGVVASQRAIDSAGAAAQGIEGVTGVTNFLRLPEPGYERLRPGLR